MKARYVLYIIVAFTLALLVFGTCNHIWTIRAIQQANLPHTCVVKKSECDTLKDVASKVYIDEKNADNEVKEIIGNDSVVVVFDHSSDAIKELKGLQYKILSDSALAYLITLLASLIIASGVFFLQKTEEQLRKNTSRFKQLNVLENKLKKSGMEITDLFTRLAELNASFSSMHLITERLSGLKETEFEELNSYLYKLDRLLDGMCVTLKDMVNIPNDYKKIILDHYLGETKMVIERIIVASELENQPIAFLVSVQKKLVAIYNQIEKL